ncbi:hypothetical protein SAMN02910298_01242 [Pseudobutyrivibrio sp. YE44]|uniref:PF20097 family protein n=1 Tax=Pseudobutyrivibrio sp. YE44 TaxID=1520802 RepID=UPI0008818367|nr:PF20097 family protein [Pseudobutyrivibrio sp. YE44]SDB24814.1 hypothetical protein SAMN02910298_01242 [Pseudobutyrivibrio sp. YE44]
MICPYCENEMRKGALSSCKPINWKEETGFAAWVSGAFGLDEHLLTSDERMFSSYVPAFFCDECKKVIIDTDIS